MWNTPSLRSLAAATLATTLATSAAAQTPASLPFYDGFEAPTLGPSWQFWTSNYGQAVPSSAESPPVGAQHLLIDTTQDGFYAEVWVTLAVDLAGESGVYLEFLHRQFDDEVNGEDGVWVSQTGALFAPILPLNQTTGTSTSTYQLHQVDLDAAVAGAGLTYTSPFYIRFRWVDNFGIPTDGFAFDEVKVHVPDCNGNGVPDFTDIALGTSLDCNLNGLPDECDIAAGTSTDLDGNGIPDDCVLPPLYADVFEVSVASGGVQNLSLLPGAVHAGEPYLLLGTTSGTSPGLPLGTLLLPLNVDSYFTRTLTSPNAPPLTGSFGLLSPSVPGPGGVAFASVTIPPGLGPAVVGVVAHHAFVTLDALTLAPNFASNPVPLGLVP